MPWVFMFMLGSFASGLVIYWTANNILTFAQQYIIMRSQGVEVDFFGNVKKSFRRKPGASDKPAKSAEAGGEDEVEDASEPKQPTGKRARRRQKQAGNAASPSGDSAGPGDETAKKDGPEPDGEGDGRPGSGT
jgi:membrane protein insertase Oxa1/YidC/SpoIIIJ